MASLRLRTFQVAAGQSETIAVSGDYVRVEKATVPIWIETEQGDGFQLDEGEEASLAHFERLIFRHDDAADQQIRLFIGDGARVGSAKVSGEVSVPAGLNVNNLKTIVQASTVTNIARTVTTSVSFLASSNANRAYLIIQNKSSAGSIWVAIGDTPTVAKGVRIGPGEKLEFTGGIVPVQSVNAIGDTPNNAEVVVMEGFY